jgi:hypothetical protein
VVTNQIRDYLLRARGLNMRVVLVEGASMPSFLTAIKQVKTEEVVVCVGTMRDGRAAELIRWPFHDVQFCIDFRASGAIGLTGPPEKVALVQTLLPFLQAPTHAVAGG